MLLLPATASARVGIGFYGGPYGYWGGPWGYPYAYGPYGYPYAYGYPYGPYGYYGGRPLGEVHIKSPEPMRRSTSTAPSPDAPMISSASTCAPGRYNIEQRIGADRQRQRIYVVAYRSVKIEFGKPGTPSPQPLPQAEPRPDADGPPPPPAPAPGAGY